MYRLVYLITSYYNINVETESEIYKIKKSVYLCPPVQVLNIVNSNRILWLNIYVTKKI